MVHASVGPEILICKNLRVLVLKNKKTLGQVTIVPSASPTHTGLGAFKQLSVVNAPVI